MQNQPKKEKGNLYIVATPIGNLKDMTIRAIEVLKEVHLVAAEDTRRARILLAAYEISTSVTSLFEHNEEHKSAFLIASLLEGKDIAYITDAGTPGVSDPGYILIRHAIDAGIRVVPIPGASAVIAGLSASGVPAGSFVFDGFIPSAPAKRKRYFAGLINETRPVVLFESPRRLLSSLTDMRAVLGDRQVVLLRELTKLFEEIMRGSITDLLEHHSIRSVKGEITLIVTPDRAKNMATAPEPADIRALFNEITAEGGCSNRDAVRSLSRKLNVPRQQIYNSVFGKGSDK